MLLVKYSSKMNEFGSHSKHSKRNYFLEEILTCCIVGSDSIITLLCDSFNRKGIAFLVALFTHYSFGGDIGRIRKGFEHITVLRRSNLPVKIVELFFPVYC